MAGVSRNLPQNGLGRYMVNMHSALLSAYMETGLMRIPLWRCRILWRDAVFM